MTIFSIFWLCPFSHIWWRFDRSCPSCTFAMIPVRKPRSAFTVMLCTYCSCFGSKADPIMHTFCLFFSWLVSVSHCTLRWQQCTKLWHSPDVLWFPLPKKLVHWFEFIFIQVLRPWPEYSCVLCQNIIQITSRLLPIWILVPSEMP